KRMSHNCLFYCFDDSLHGQVPGYRLTATPSACAGPARGTRRPPKCQRGPVGLRLNETVELGMRVTTALFAFAAAIRSPAAPRKFPGPTSGSIALAAADFPREF